eukprot:s3649_g3.t1
MNEGQQLDNTQGSESFISLVDGENAERGEELTDAANTGSLFGSSSFSHFNVESPSERIFRVQNLAEHGQSEPKSPAEEPGTEERPDVAISTADYNRALFEARMSMLGDAGVKLPWETGVMGKIFGDSEDDIFPGVLPSVPVDYFNEICPPATSAEESDGLGDIVTAKQFVQSDVPVPFYSRAIKVLPDRDVHSELDMLWHSALLKWQQVFEILGYPGPLGNALFAEQLETEIHTDSVVLRDSLGIKSPRTAIKRAQTLLRFMSWMQSQFNECLQWDRNRVLLYLSEPTSCATKGTTLLEAFRFAKFVMQLPIPDDILGDPQVRGKTQRMLAAKDSYKPARPLKASELAALEHAIETDLDVRDVYMIGAAIFAILSRSRWSDLKHVHQFWVEREWYNGQLFGFVEARTQFHKTATTLVKKKLFMPLVAPLLGVTDVDWSRHWMASFDKLGVDTTVEPFGAICRAPDHSGGLCKRSVTTEEIGVFLNGFLRTPKESQISSHSLKHTTLSWCSSYGIDEPSRTLLGHHELQGAKALCVYSRDMLTRPLQLYCAMLSNIRCDHFRPDESRTSRMLDLMKIADKATAVGTEQPAGDAEPGVGLRAGHKIAGDADESDYAPTTPVQRDELQPSVQVPSDNESSDIQSTDSSSSSDSSGEDAFDKPPHDIEGPLWRNRRSAVVHKCSNVDRQTACGRLVDETHFELLMDGCSTLSARCSRCSRGEVVSSVDGLVNALDIARAKRLRKA